MDEDQHKYNLLMMHCVLTKLTNNISKQCQKQIAKYNARLHKHHKFSVGDRVYLFNHTKQKLDDKWLDGCIIVKQNGSISFMIKHQKNGNMLKAHANDPRLHLLWKAGKFLRLSKLTTEQSISVCLTQTQMTSHKHTNTKC